MEPEKHQEEESSLKGVERSPMVRSLGLLALIFSLIPMIVLVPLAFVPDPTGQDPYLARFYSPKFEVLIVFSLPLLVAVTAAVVVDRKHLKVPVLFPALAFLGVSILSVIFSGSSLLQNLIGDRFDGLLSTAAGVLLFYALARFLDSWRRVRIFLAAGVVTAVLIAIYGILQNLRLDPIPALYDVPWRGGERVFSALGHPVHLAGYLTLMMGAALALYFMSGERWQRRLWLAALAVMGACWLYTYTRGAILAAVVGLPIILWLAYRRIGGVRPLFAPLAVLAVAIFAAQLLSAQPGGVLERFLGGNPLGSTTNLVAQLPASQFVNVAYRTGGAEPARAPADSEEPAPKEEPPPVEQPAPEGSDSSVATRLLIWRDTLPMILDRPVLGWGPDNFRGPFSAYVRDDLRDILNSRRETIDKTHNEFLQIAVTTGLLGLAAYLWVFVSYFRNVYRRGGWVLLGLASGVLVYILQLQTAFTTVANGVVFWAILGVSVAVMRMLDSCRSSGDAASASRSLVGAAPE